MKDNIVYKKKYGQNFLVNKNIIYNILNEINPEANNLVIEVGPGSGILTKELSKKFNKVLAYEIDKDLADVLSENLKEEKNVDIIFDDFMTRDVLNDLKDYNKNNIYFIANLPYYITTPIINKLINLDINIKKIIIMVQKEVADRLSAKAGTKDYNSLTVFLNYYYDIKKLFNVSKNNFKPIPNVDSAIVMMDLKKEKLFLNDKDLFFKFIRDSFKYKRKTLKNNLKDYDLKKIEKVLSKYDLSLNVRAEQLSLEIFVNIVNYISGYEE